ncbi:MAG TPA: acyltransferase family protein [Micromonosporaceae bacterium]|nr:acyltransferase family protein [Micromonosporaceae bacterium]
MSATPDSSTSPAAKSQTLRPAGPMGNGLKLAYRTDIEGMRAVAVLLVVLGHAGIGLFSGGYVGVDVFFVISGFLITSLLLKETSATGTISISRFYARRALRLLPASTVVVIATLIGSWLWLSPIRFTDRLVDTVATAFYAINIRLAVNGTDYLAATDPPSPFQHFWSLAVEEQFYILWPLLILVAAKLGRRRGWSGPTTISGALLLLICASFLLSVTETVRNAPWAYFGTHTRAWELGLGALLALVGGHLSRLPNAVATVLSWIGLAAIVTAAISFNEKTAFPGYVAALPVVGAVLVIAGGFRNRRWGAGLILDLPPFQLLGRLSYGWYLWHWPILVIAPAALGVRTSVLLNLLLCAVALVIAKVSLDLVENPLRRHKVLQARPARGIGLGLSLSCGVVAVVLVAVTVPPAVTVGDDATDLPRTMAGGMDHARVMADLVAQATVTQRLPANLTPSLQAVEDDVPVIYPDGCHLGVKETDIPGGCVYGDVDSPTNVVLFGDSHAAQWFPALERLASQHGWRLVPITKSSCPAGDLLLYEDSLKRAYTECQTWRSNALKHIAELTPDLVVISSMMSDQGFGHHVADPEREWRDGWARTLSALRRPGTAVAVIADTPHLAVSGPDCVAQHSDSLTVCAPAIEDGVREPARRAAIVKLAKRSGAAVIDPIPWLCQKTCPLVIGNVLVYRDVHHLTTVFVKLVAPLLYDKIPPLQS